MMKLMASFIVICLILGIANPILAQEVFQPYEHPRNYAPYGTGDQPYRSYNSPSKQMFSVAPGIQVYQNFDKPWNSSPYAGEDGYQQFNTNPWGGITVTPRQR